ncbi:CoA transferase [Phenylobacterium sp. LjRoot225]|uniref:CaiB/BaiF CoA transferase family protein n=1 Tax=Phenylobacterium sp. LjRoot225 TaxID=3342285 RepID=UPI003ED152FC
MTPSAPTLPMRLEQPSGPGPLTGVRLIDFTRVLAGPFATQILGDLGAEVIKIENPLGGDDTRAIRPSAELGGETAFFLSLNRSKQSVAIDLKSEAGREIVPDLIATADVLVENFTGAVMRRFQLDYASLRERFPKLIYCSVSGYGRTGRNADAAGYDSPLSAEAGALALNAYAGQPAVLGGIPYTDISTALNATIGILAALQARTRDGKGQHVDIAMFDSTLANLSYVGCEFLTSGRETALYERQSAGPRGQFDTADGEITISCGKDKMFRALCAHVLERPEWLDDPQYATLAERMRNEAAFLADIGAIFRTQPSAVWSERCKRAGIPCGAVRTPGEALLSPEASERGLVFGLPHPTAGVAPVIAQPFQFSETPVRYEVPPLLGQHTKQVLQALLGYEDSHVAELAASGAIALGRTETAAR